MPFTFESTPIDGLVVINPRVFPDGRGFFVESYKQSEFMLSGLNVTFRQDNHSKSAMGVLRGLHFQKGKHAQGKLIRVISGKVWDVVVDIRPDSISFKKWFGLELSSDNFRMLYAPPGCAHGFVTLEDDTQFLYKCTEEYNKESEGGIHWNDPELAIQWPLADIIVSEKDTVLPLLKDINCGELWI